MKPHPFLTPGVTSHAPPTPLLPLIPERDVQLFSFCLPPPLSFPTSPDNLWTSPYSHLQCPEQLPQQLKTWVGELCFYIFAVFAYFAFQLLHRGAGSFRKDAAEICPGRVELRVVGVMDSYLHVWLSLWSLGLLTFTVSLWISLQPFVTRSLFWRSLGSYGFKSTCPRSPARSCICWLMSHCAIRRRCWRLGSGARVWVQRAWIKAFTPLERGWV